jgi:hypothetical protein
MPVVQSFQFIRFQDGLLEIGMLPSEPISGWSINFQVFTRPGGTVPLINKYLASGFINGESGMYLVNGAAGVYSVALHAGDTSGFLNANYYYTNTRTDSGNVKELSRGFITMR